MSSAAAKQSKDGRGHGGDHDDLKQRGASTEPAIQREQRSASDNHSVVLSAWCELDDTRVAIVLEAAFGALVLFG